MAIWPFIVLRERSLSKDKVVMNHEKIHLKQQLELFIIGFFICYGIEFVIKRFSYKSNMETYRNLSFEREAYQNETDLLYLKKRKYLSFINYL